MREVVTGGIEKVGEILVVALDVVDLGILQGVVENLVLHVARPDDDQPGIGLPQLRHARDEPVDALLSGKTRDARIEGAAEIGGHAKVVEDFLPVRPLSDLVVVEGCSSWRACRRWRIPDIDIQAVDDADEIVVAAPIEDGADTAEADVVVEKLLAVGAADGGDLVGRHDAVFKS